MINTSLMALEDIPNKTLLLVLMGVLIVFIVLLLVLGIVFIVALRKRRPVVKVVMAPMAKQAAAEELTEEEEAAEQQADAEAISEPSEEEVAESAADDDAEEAPIYVTEGHEQVRYNRSFTAKVCQLNNETKEWYSELKNELLSYDRVKERMSWARESFRVGRLTIARLAIRGKTLCLLMAVEPVSYNGTKYVVEDVSDVATTADTPTMYRIKSARRLKYAKEMISGMMKELQTYKQPMYEAQDYFLPYDGDMSLMQRGLIKRVVSNSTRTFKLEEVDEAEAAEVAATTEEASAETAEKAPAEKAPSKKSSSGKSGTGKKSSSSKKSDTDATSAE